MLKFSIYNTALYLLLHLLATIIKTQQQCNAMATLPNILQFTKTLHISKSQHIHEQYSISYNEANFDNKPSVVMSINRYDCGLFKDIDYRLSTTINDSNVVIKFVSNNMQWQSINIIIWLSSRLDLYTGTIPLQNIKQGISNTDIKLPHNIKNNIKFVNMITSLSISTEKQSSKYVINCTSQYLKQEMYRIYVKVGNYIVFSISTSVFAADGGQFEAQFFYDIPIYIKIQKNVAPIKYFITGFNSFVFQPTNKLKLNMQLDHNFVFQLNSNIDIQLIKIVYLAINKPIPDICKCVQQKGDIADYYVYKDRCVSKCPEGSYAQDGYGRVCLTCSIKLHQIIDHNQNNAGCKCIDGYVRNQQDICIIDKQKNINIDTQNNMQKAVSQMKVRQIIGYKGLKNNLVASSETPQRTFDPRILTIISNQANINNSTNTTDNISNSNTDIHINMPIITKSNVDDIATLSMQQIMPTSNLTSDNDPNKLVINQLSTLNLVTITDTLTLKCPQNQIFSNVSQKCQCNQFSISTNSGTCFRCSRGSFKSNNMCRPCPGFCLQCTSTTSCDKCQDGNKFDPSVRSCVPFINRRAITTPSSNITANSSQGFSLEPIKTPTQLSTFSSETAFVPTSDSSFGSFDSSFSSDFFNTGSFDSFTSTPVEPSTPSSNSPPTTNINSISFSANSSSTNNNNPSINASKNINDSPQCGENKTLVDSQCICDKFSVILQDNTCFKCLEGSYKDQTVDTCLPCIDHCLSCSGVNNCQFCNGSRIFNNKINQCEIIANPTPTQPTINKCNSRSIYFNGICIQCPSPTYKDISLDQQQNFCSPCTNVNPECLTCQSATKCLKCDNNLQVDQTGQKCICLQPRYLIEGLCRQCPPGFVYFQQRNTCINPALNNLNITTIPNNSNNISNKTRPNIDTPTTDITTTNKTIVQCGFNQQLQSGKCICTAITVNISGVCKPCEPQFFKFGQICVNCPQDCLNCTQFTNCLQCKPTYIFDTFNNYCRPSCPVDQILVFDICVCVQPLFRNSKGICQRCPSGTMLMLDKCIDCSVNCEQCRSINQCTRCLTGYNLVNGGVQDIFCCRNNQIYNMVLKRCQCNNGFRNISGQCGICPQGLVYFNATQKCIPPIIVPPTCSQNQILAPNNTCICNQKTIRKLNNRCQPCQSGFYISKNSCMPCLTNCINCINSTNCNFCQSNYTGKNCQLCAQGYKILNPLTTPKICQRQLCGNINIDKGQQCDDGNTITGDGCSSNCLIQNGYICTPTCTQIIIKTKQSITSAGIFSQFIYRYPQISSNLNLLSYFVTNGKSPTNIKIIRPVNDPSILKIFVDYCGLLPQQNIITQLSTNSQLGIVKFISQYDLINKTTIKALRDSQFLK